MDIKFMYLCGRMELWVRVIQKLVIYLKLNVAFCDIQYHNGRMNQIHDYAIYLLIQVLLLLIRRYLKYK